MSKPHYQENLSLSSPILLDKEYKAPKIAKMLSILKAANLIGYKRRGIAVDLGCSGGLFTHSLTQHFEHIIGIDIDPHALALAQSENNSPNIFFLLGSAEGLPLPSNSVELLLCNHVYEHVPDASRLFSEIERILKPGGSCYLGAASRLTLIEPHYHLPFLSWLPKPLAHRYMRLTGHGSYYYENLRTLGGIRKLISRFNTTDYTLQVIADPDRFHARDLLPKKSLLDQIPMWTWRAFYYLLPSYIFILTKK
jgi:SAM-dependent methyltransferase